MCDHTGTSPRAVTLADVDAHIDRRLSALPARTAAAGRAHLAAGGQRRRAMMALSTADALGLSAPEQISLAAACELVHNAALVHDDLQDRDTRRRGRPSVWHAEGAETALILGDFLLSAAHMAMAETGASRASGRLHAAVAETIAGQVADRAASLSPLCDLDHYEQIAGRKSGPLIALAVTAPLACAGRDEALGAAEAAANRFAIAYQMRDDIADVDDDAARPDRAERLNAVFVIARARGLAMPAAMAACRARAVAHFTAAQAQAAALPSGAGAALAAEAGRLALPFKETHHAA